MRRVLGTRMAWMERCVVVVARNSRGGGDHDIDAPIACLAKARLKTFVFSSESLRTYSEILVQIPI